MLIIKDKVNNIDVTYIKTNKFKTVYGQIYFTSPIKKDIITKRCLINRLLVKSCKKYNTNEKLNIVNLENYGADYESSYTGYGNSIINSFSFSCINDKYVNDNVIEKVVDTFKEILFNPNASNNEFDKETFDLCYKVLKTELLNEKEDTRNYCYKNMLKTLDDTKAYSYFKNLDDLEKINEKNLYEEYKNMINNSEVKLILVGDFDYKKYANDILKNVKSKKYNFQKYVENRENKREVLIKKETIDCIGSVIFVGFKCFNLTKYERSYVVPIFSRILGGGATSRCFDIIREKESLAYYCYSKYDKADSILSVYAGIDKNNFDKVYKLILDIFNNMKEVKDEELMIAKKDITSSLMENYDYISALSSLNYYKEFNEEEDLEARIKLFNNVSIDDLKKVFKKIKADCIYFVEGNDNNEED